MARGQVLLVERTGPLMLIQDLGRPGRAAFGVPPSGALDRPALRRANALLDNDVGCAGLEIVLGGARLRALDSCRVAVTGAPVAVRVDGAESAFDVAIDLGAAQILTLGRAVRGLRMYLAVSGGLHSPRVLGSASTDVLSGLGPPPVRPGDVLSAGPRPAPGILPGQVEAEPAPPSAHGFRITAGPRLDHFAPGSWDQLLAGRWTVGSSSNRIGLRLEGSPLQRLSAGELPSEGLVTGAVQVPASGLPVIFLADHPTTGGYPVIAVVDQADLPLAAQLRPGQRLRFIAG